MNNKRGRRTSKALVEERRHYALTLSYTIKTPDTLLAAVNAQAEVRRWGIISKRQLFHDLDKANGDLFASLTPEELSVEWGLRRAQIAQMEMTIEKLAVYIMEQKPEGREFVNAVSVLFKMQAQLMEFHGWNLSKKVNYLSSNFEDPRKICHLFHRLPPEGEENG